MKKDPARPGNPWGHRPTRIRVKLLLATVGIMAGLYLLTNICINIFLQPYLEEMAVDRFDDTQQKRAERFGALKEELERTFRGLMESREVQAALESKEPSVTGRTALERRLKAYYTADFTNILYVDNKGRVFSAFPAAVPEKRDRLNALLQDERLRDSYALPVWDVRDYDVLGKFSGGFLYVMQNVRHLELDVEPGVLILQLPARTLDRVGGIVSNEHERVLMRGASGAAVYPTERVQTDGVIWEKIDAGELDGPTGWLGRELVSFYRDQRTGWEVASYVSYPHLMGRLYSLQGTILLLSAAMLFVSIVVVSVLTSHYVSPIRILIKAMRSFNNRRFDERVVSRLPDEFGLMGDTFNAMADEIEKLLEDTRKNQEALKIAELDSLIYQINPHFIYNTLDNIYMLARISGEERISLLIDALSKFLRISLSKGSSLIKLRDEIEHVRNYLLIQQIRYEGLFTFEIDLDFQAAECLILKFILQPLVENSINHGFQGMEEGGIIQIRGFSEGETIHIEITDNGQGIDAGAASIINEAGRFPRERKMELFPNQKGGYGIGNVLARLGIYYQDHFTLRYTREERGTKCVMILPKKFDF